MALSTTARAAGANERLIVGVIGPGGMGSNHVRLLSQNKQVDVAWVCDVDELRRGKAAETVQKNSGRTPKAVKDLRQVLDDKSVDAVWIATPDHWHAPATILACDAGKHVYVEKPCSHNIREGRLMIDAARRNNRVVQVGTQTRSTAAVREAMAKLREGVIGDVLVSKAWNSQRRSSIGHTEPSDPPSTLDFDLWVGPAPLVAYRTNLLPSIWRWWYDFGAGDMGNDGVHEIDVAVWGLGVDTHPSSVAALGGKFFFDDDQQYPDTQYVVFEYPGDGKIGHKRQLIFEQRIWSPYVQEDWENGDAFYGTQGMMMLGKKGGYKIFGPRNKLIEEVDLRRSGPAGPPCQLHGVHQSGERPNADIEINHLSTTLCHLGNIATRVRRKLEFDPRTRAGYQQFRRRGAGSSAISRRALGRSGRGVSRPDGWVIIDVSCEARASAPWDGHHIRYCFQDDEVFDGAYYARCGWSPLALLARHRRVAVAERRRSMSFKSASTVSGASYLQALLDRDELPTFKRLQDEGAYTHNARTDWDFTITLPNHTCMVTGRPVRDQAQPTRSSGTSGRINTDPGERTLHSNRHDYVASAFDVAHDQRPADGDVRLQEQVLALRSVVRRSGPAPRTRPAKTTVATRSTCTSRTGCDEMTDRFIAEMKANPFNYSFLHFADTDSAGHSKKWGSPEYNEALRKVDGLLGRILELVETDERLRGKTAIIISADHGGIDYNHGFNTNPINYTIPFYVWGAGVSHTDDLYSLNRTSRVNPGNVAAGLRRTAPPSPSATATAATWPSGCWDWGRFPAR